jgi:hypothetical protein
MTGGKEGRGIGGLENNKEIYKEKFGDILIGI